MGLIYKQVTLIGSKGSKRVNALMDTGASESFINRETALEIADLVRLPEPMKAVLGQGTSSTNEAIIAYLELDGQRLHWAFIVLPNLSEELICGADFFQRWKIKLDPETEQIIFDPTALRIQLI